MGIVDDVADELDRLIDRPGGISTENLVHCPTITALLAHGDFEQAFLVIEGIRRRNTSRDVAAAFAHLGGFGYRGNTEDRLCDFAVDHHDRHPRGRKAPSSRTVRRWSEAGQRVLVDTIVQASGIAPPTLHLDVISRGGTTMVVLPTIYHMHGYVMNDPLLIVVGADTHAVHGYRIDEMDVVAENIYQPASELEVDVGIPAHLLIIWHGEVQPTLVTRSIGSAADIIQMSSMTNGAVGVMLYRDGQDIDTLADIAAELGRLHADAAEEIE